MQKIQNHWLKKMTYANLGALELNKIVKMLKIPVNSCLHYISNQIFQYILKVLWIGIVLIEVILEFDLSEFVEVDILFCVFVPTPLVGGRNYILKWVFFVQSILADRYIHRREMWVVSLKSWSSIEFKIKKIFLFPFFSRSYRGLKFCVNTGYLFTFSVIFQIKMFSIKIEFQTSISCNKWNNFVFRVD